MTTTPELRTPAVQAIEDIREQFVGHEMVVSQESDGTFIVIVDDVHVGDQYNPSTTWLGFRITAAYPNADIYPHFIGPVVRRDGSALGEGVQPTTWQDRPALQLSRRSKGWNPRRDTALLKTVKVLAWFAGR